MADILIKGMEMPTGGTVITVYKIDGKLYATRGLSGRLFPLVSVPPHGRLIDADAIRQSIKESIDECHAWAEEVNEGEMYARVSQALGTFVECSLRVKAAPTIIPAEEGET